MRGINPRKIPDYIAKDVKKVEDYARIVLVLNSDNCTIEIRENEDFKMNTIAVIGPSFGFGREWEKVVLLEIGIGHARPYRELTGHGRFHIYDRRKWFYLTAEQYRLVAPIIFKKMDFLAYEVVNSWKTGSYQNRFVIPCSWRRFYRSTGKTLRRDSLKDVQRGIKFSVSLKDELLMRDVYWAELSLNERVKSLIRGLVGYVDLRLNRYSGHSGRGRFKSLKGAKQVERALNKAYLNRFPHLMAEVIYSLRRRKFRFLQEILEMTSFDFYEPTKEREMASMVLSDPNLRLGGIQIMVTTSLEKKKDYIVFEVQK